MEKIFKSFYEMLEFHTKQEKERTEWEYNRISDMQIRNYNSPLESFSCGMDGTGEDLMYLHMGDRTVPIRDTSIRGIFDRAKISGQSLSALDKETLVIILNKCFALYPKKQALCLIRDGKLTACHSGEEYKIIPISEILIETQKAISTRFYDNEFKCGYSDYSFSVALWEIFDKELESKYASIFKTDSVKCRVKVCTSDTGDSAVRIYPIVETREKVVPLGSALYVEHKGNGSIEKVKEVLTEIYSMFVEASEKISELKKINIEYPVNCMTRLAKTLHLPKKASLEAIKKFEDTYVASGEDINACDIYFGLCDVLTYIPDTDQKKKVDIEETIKRVLHINLANYDLAKAIEW